MDHTTTAPHGATSNPAPFIWIALVSRVGELSIPSTDAERAKTSTRRGFRLFHENPPSDGPRKSRRPTPPLPPEVVAERVDRDLGLFENGGILTLSSESEAVAFQLYAVLSKLRPFEAFRRWRIGFPLPAGDDDELIEVLRRLEEAPETLPPDAG